MTKVRIDTLLTQRGVYSSRSRAAASVIAGEVMVGRDRRRIDKPGQMVSDSIEIAVADVPAFVSRGGIKLTNALRQTGLPVTGRNALDVGASTGGFTDCLLQQGAAHVVAVDVAYGELDWGLRNDPRVTVLERTNARELKAEQLPYKPDLIVGDVSFISMSKILPALLGCAAARFDALVLCKPQFEVGRERVGKGGVVRDAETRRDALRTVAAVAIGLGASVAGFASSQLPGPKGNLETFVWLAERGRAGLGDIESALREVEP
ncbi:MAG: TlyA family RNA methyltransferase [Solirubrobacterales bacterium]|nr:TlyA family RNA methyltransferase [Solirubrobacterales bacterium]